VEEVGMQKYTLEEVVKLLRARADELGAEAYGTRLLCFREAEEHYRSAARLVENLDSGGEAEPTEDGAEATAQPIQRETRPTPHSRLKTEETPKAVAQLNPAQKTVLKAIKELNGPARQGVGTEKIVAYGTNIAQYVEKDMAAGVHYPAIKARLDELCLLDVIDRAKKSDDDHTYYYVLNDPEEDEQ